MNLFTNWKDTLKHWSLWLSGVGTAALTFFFAFPDQALGVWNAMPPEVKSLLPEMTGVQISLALLVASILAKFIKQETVIGWVKGAGSWLAAMTKSIDNAE